MVAGGGGRRGYGGARCAHEDRRGGLRSRLVLDGSEVGGLDRGVGLHGGRVAVGDDGAVVEHAHVVADAHDEAHVVLHQQDGHAPMGQVHEHVSELDGLLLVQARARLVDQEHRRSRGQGPAELDESGQARGEQVGGLVGDVGQPDVSQDDVGLGTRGRPGGAPTPGSRPPSGCSRAPSGSRRARAAGRCGRSRAGPGDAGSTPVMSWPPKTHPALGRRLQSGDDVEERRLAGSVGPDETVHGAGVHVEIDVLECLEPAEANGDLLDGELRQRSEPRSRPRSWRRPEPGRGTGAESAGTASSSSAIGPPRPCRRFQKSVTSA